jgi:GNAT superfamily N-acetyltransferase
VTVLEVVVRDMQPDDEYFVLTCSHVHESEEIDACAERRRDLFRDLAGQGGMFRVALIDDEHAGFAYGLPIDRAPWGPLGQDLMVIPCLYVLGENTGHGAGQALIESIEHAALKAGFTGVTVTAYRDIPGAEWFMPAAYFERLGYRAVDGRGTQALLWKPFRDDAFPPHFLQPHYVFEPVAGKVAVDLFRNGFCQTSGIEAQRVREVCAEFGGRVVLREYDAEDRETLLRYQIPRAIYVNGEEIFWGYEAPREGIRAAIEKALEASS